MDCVPAVSAAPAALSRHLFWPGGPSGHSGPWHRRWRPRPAAAAPFPGLAVLALARRALRDSEGCKLPEPPIFDASAGDSVATVTFHRRPFGVLAYAPSQNGRGAMVWQLGQERYPGDPQGRAAGQGVQEGYAVRSINGRDVSSWPFQDILDLLNDKILDNSSGKFQSLSHGSMANDPAPLPVTVEYVQVTVAPVVPVLPVLPLEAEALPGGVLPYRGVDAAFVDELLAACEAHAGGVVLSLEDLIRFVAEAEQLFRQEQSLQEVQVKEVVVVGDLHGQFGDLLRIFQQCGRPNGDRPYLFNGDFVDRGPHSLEVILTLLALKMCYPQAVLMNRGNHEAADLNLRYGFASELRSRYGTRGREAFEAFAQLWRWLPLAHVLNGEVFVVHAGLPGPDPRLPFNDAGGQGTGYDAMEDSGRRGGGQKLSLLGYNPDNVSLPPRRAELTLAELRRLPRGGDPAVDLGALERLPEEEAEVQRLIVDLLWADPRGKTGYGPSYRVRKGCYIFGPDVTTAFLKKNGLRLLIRSHEVKVQGYEWTHPDCITVFSAPNYLGHARNKGAVVKLQPDEHGHLVPSFLTYEAET